MPSARSRGRAKRARPPTVLSTVYGPELCTLKTLILRLVAPRPALPSIAAGDVHPDGLEDASYSEWSFYSDLLKDFRSATSSSLALSDLELVQEPEMSTAQQVSSALVVGGDSPDYLNLLHNTYGILQEGAPHLGRIDFRQRWTQREVVDRVVELQFRQRDRPDHVLCAGYRKLRAGGASHTNLDAPRGLECVFRNTTVDILKSEPWLTLLSRVGDMIMLYLLSNASLFISLPGNCFLQVAGPAIYAVSSKVPPKLKTGQPSLLRSERLKNLPKDSTRCSVDGRTQRRVKRKRMSGEAGDDVSAGHAPKRARARAKGNCLGRLHKPGEGEAPKPNKVNSGSVHCTHMDERMTGIVQGKNVWECGSEDIELESLSFSGRAETAEHCKMESVSGKVAGHCEESRPELYHKRYVQRCSTSTGAVVSTGTVLTRSKKRTRPSSWQRRKAAKLERTVSDQRMNEGSTQTKANPTAADVDVGQLLLSGSVSSLVTTSSDCKLTLDRVGHHMEGTEGTKPMYFSCTIPLDCCPESWEGNQSEPVDSRRDHLYNLSSPSVRSINQANEFRNKVERSSIFYSSAFAHHAGLPLKHILNAVRPNNEGALQLFQAIFGQRDELPSLVVTETGESEQSGSLTASGIRGLLKRMLQNSRKCRYALLLDRHCPLPRGPVHKVADPPAFSSAAEVLISKSQSTSMKKEAGHRDTCANIHSKQACNQSTDDGGWSFMGSSYCAQMAVLVSRSSHNPTTAIDALGSVSTDPVSTDMEDSDLREDEVTSAQQFVRHPKANQSSRLSSHNPTTAVDALGSASTDPVGTDIEDSDLREDEVTGAQQIVCDKGTGGLHQDSTGRPVSTLTCGSPLLEAMVAGEVNSNSKDSGEQRSCQLSQEELIASFCTHTQVVAFIWAVSRRVIPAQLLGCNKSRRALRRSLARFISLRRHEKFSLTHFFFRLGMQGFARHEGGQPGTQKPFLKAPTRRMLELWCSWYFTRFVGPLLRAHFYVTENENHRRDVFYYRKPVWARIKSTALKNLVDTSFKVVSPSCLVSTLKKKILGFSKIRFLPKENGVRPIVNLGASSRCTVRSDVQKEPLTFKEVFGQVGQPIHRRETNGSRSGQNLSLHLGRKFQLVFKPVNTVLRDVHSCLKSEQVSHAEDLGCSVFGYNDTYMKLVPFVMQLKSSGHGLPRLFFGICDVAKAFDTIQQSKLCDIVSKFLQQKQYTVRRYVSVVPTVGGVRVCHERACTTWGEHQNFIDFASSLTRKSQNSIYTDQVFFAKLCRERILAMLDDHVRKNILQVGSKFYMQTVGIPQGSVVSSLLCCLFYGHLDRHCLLPCLQKFVEPNCNGHVTEHPFPSEGERERSLMAPSPANLVKCSLEKGPDSALVESGCGGGRNICQSKAMLTDVANTGPDIVPAVATNAAKFMLLRLIDDSLFISTSQAQVSLYVDKMHNGFEEYGCHANKRKTAVSFDMYCNEQFIPMNVYQTEDGARFMRWCGLLVNCYTLEIQADYTRYCGEHVGSSLTVVVENNQGNHLVIKLCQFMRPKCHPLFYDLNINSPATVRLNAYQAFLLCAMKFHAYVRAMPRVGACNPTFLFKAIWTTIRYMHRLVKQRMHAIGRISSFRPCFSFPLQEMEWLGWTAFRKVLLRKQCGHKQLILLIETELSARRYSEMPSSLYLSSAVDERRSCMFKSIKY